MNTSNASNPLDEDSFGKDFIVESDSKVYKPSLYQNTEDENKIDFDKANLDEPFEVRSDPGNPLETD
jgi:hypothetical protein